MTFRPSATLNAYADDADRANAGGRASRGSVRASVRGVRIPRRRDARACGVRRVDGDDCVPCTDDGWGDCVRREIDIHLRLPGRHAPIVDH